MFLLLLLPFTCRAHTLTSTSPHCILTDCSRFCLVGGRHCIHFMRSLASLFLSRCWGFMDWFPTLLRSFESYIYTTVLQSPPVVTSSDKLHERGLTEVKTPKLIGVSFAARPFTNPSWFANSKGSGTLRRTNCTYTCYL